MEPGQGVGQARRNEGAEGWEPADTQTVALGYSESSPEAPLRPGVGRATFLVSLVLMLLVLAAAIVWPLMRIDQLTKETSTLQRQVNELTQVLDGATERLDGVEESVDDTRADVSKVDKKVTRVKRKADETLNPSKVTREAMPSVVTVGCGDDLGSGFAIDIGKPPAGYRTAVLTNHHVVESCTYVDGPGVQVLKDGGSTTAELYSWDEDNDLALVLIGTRLPRLKTADSPVVGDQVVAIGSPYGLEGTVTTGVVSNTYDRFFQTDAAINPGNSGGPLLDRNGKVLGVTTFKLPGSEGANFAVRMRVRCEALIDCG